MKKKSFSVSEFKSKSLGLLEEISRTGEGIVVTKRGKPIAKSHPVQRGSEKPEPGRLRDMLISEDDIVSPLGAKLWKAAEAGRLMKYLLDTHTWIWWNSRSIQNRCPLR